MNKFRNTNPYRTCKKKYQNYHSYKDFLSNDFNKRCGYCNDEDQWIGGINIYHIDHFAPKKQFPDLANEYKNLVYSCPICNNAKSNKWYTDDALKSVKDNQGFLDPCEIDLNLHFERDDDGSILAKTEIGRFIWNELQLFLPRHSTIWKLSNTDKEIQKIEDSIETTKNLELKNELENLKSLITAIYYNLHKELRELNEKK